MASYPGRSPRSFLLRLRLDAFRHDTLERGGLHIQSGFDGGRDATLGLFVAVLFIIALRVACHVDRRGRALSVLCGYRRGYHRMDARRRYALSNSPKPTYASRSRPCRRNLLRVNTFRNRLEITNAVITQALIGQGTAMEEWKKLTRVLNRRNELAHHQVYFDPNKPSGKRYKLACVARTAKTGTTKGRGP